MKKSAIAIALTSALLMIGSAYAAETGETKPKDGSGITGLEATAGGVAALIVASIVNDSNEESGNNTSTGTGTTTTSTGTGTGTTTTSVTN